MTGTSLDQNGENLSDRGVGGKACVAARQGDPLSLRADRRYAQEPYLAYATILLHSGLCRFAKTM
jgi:hypothetical protein